MANVFQTQSWAIKVPNSWGVDDSEEAIAFAPENTKDVALVISAYYKDSNIAPGEMREAIQSAAHDGSVFCEVQMGDYTGFHTSYARLENDGEFFWRIWCVCCRNVHLCITYNCPIKRKGKDDESVNDMLKTLMCLLEDE